MNDDGISTATDLSNSLAAPNFFEIDIVYFFFKQHLLSVHGSQYCFKIKFPVTLTSWEI